MEIGVELDTHYQDTDQCFSKQSARLPGRIIVHNFIPLQSLKECYNRIPILYGDETRFDDLISGQTFTEAEEQLCSKSIQIYFTEILIKTILGLANPTDNKS